MDIIDRNRQAIFNLCEKHKVKNLYAFGSVLTNRFNDNSDIDFLFTFNDEIDYNNYADNYFDLIEQLKKLFGRDIDLVDSNTLRNPYFIEEVESHKQLIYGH